MEENNELEEKDKIENIEAQDVQNPEDTIEEKDTLQDYEIEIEEKKSFLAKILDKFKKKKEQKLLDCSESEKAKRANVNIIFRWGLGAFRSQIIENIDNAYKNLVHKKVEKKSNKEEVITTIIGKESNLVDDIKLANKKVSKLIIPKNVEKRKE